MLPSRSGWKPGSSIAGRKASPCRASRRPALDALGEALALSQSAG